VAEVLTVAGAIAAVAAALAAIAQWVVRPSMKLTKRIREFLDDFYGEVARPGVPGRPGVMVQLSAIKAELHPNHGSSLRDAVDATRRLVEDHIGDEAAHGNGSPR
jgi:hypothetical protein